ncbi:MAG: NRDE family protein [Pseudomonadota bacterium]
MCLVLIGYQVSNKYPLIFAANRDEFHQRPTDPMHFWEQDSCILAGKDLEQGGTWFGVHTSGRFAALTNYRDPSSDKTNAPSRGEIIVDLLTSQTPCDLYFIENKKKMTTYNGFNLLFGNIRELFWFSNVQKRVEKIPSGIHGLSNQDLNTAWPKVERGKKALKQTIKKSITPPSLFSVLADQHIPKDPLLPDTGVGIEWERLLSPVFIQSDTYGTRSSTVMLINQKGNMRITERTYPDPGNSKLFTDRDFLITPQA